MPRARAERGSPRGALLTGRRAVLEALRAGRRPLHELLLSEAAGGPELDALRAAARAAGVPIRDLPARELERAGDAGNPQGVALDAGPLPEPSLAELVPPQGPCCFVVLDGVEDPRNLGAVARVAEAAGAAGLVLARRHSPPLSGVACRASAGALEWLPVTRVPNLVRALGALKDQGFWVFGGDAVAGEPLFELPERQLAERRVVVLGAEGRGLRRGVLESLDHRVRIPMRGRVASLNVATAAAVLLFELGRRSAQAPPG